MCCPQALFDVISSTEGKRKGSAELREFNRCCLKKENKSKTTNMISCNIDVVIWELQRAEFLCLDKQRNRNSNSKVFIVKMILVPWPYDLYGAETRAAVLCTFV